MDRLSSNSLEERLKEDYISRHGERLNRTVYRSHRAYYSYPYWITLYEAIDQDLTHKYKNEVENIIRNMNDKQLSQIAFDLVKVGPLVLNILVDKISWRWLITFVRTNYKGYFLALLLANDKISINNLLEELNMNIDDFVTYISTGLDFQLIEEFQVALYKLILSGGVDINKLYKVIDDTGLDYTKLLVDRIILDQV